MCTKWLDSELCMNYRCPHNLFWEGLRLNLNKIHITDKALEIRNCCCLINEPWTVEEIGEVWGLTMEKIMRCEGMAWEKIHKKNGWGQSDRAFFSSLD
jgi:hypothetical protein